MDKRIITSGKISIRAYLMNVWRSRTMIWVLARRDIRIKYAQTVLGISWAVIQPLVAILIYTVFFYMILNIRTGDVPYPLFVLPGIMAWFHFTRMIDDAGTSLQSNQELIRKVDFPKLMLPISKLFSSLIDVGITLFLFFILMLIYDQPITWRVLMFPAILFMNILAAFSIALWLSSLTIKYRDFHHIIPFLISFGIWITPVFYPTTIVPPNLEKYMYFNPITGILAGYRWSLLNMNLPDWHYLFGYVPILIILIGGIFYFLKIERDIVDHI